MKKILSIIVVVSVLSVTVKAQTLGEFKPKDMSYGLGKLKGKASKVYIASFNVNYQVYNEKQDFKQGGSTLGGGFKGDALAEISVGLDGLSNQDVQKITNQLYADYVAQLKLKGLTIITADEAQKTSVYTDFVKLKGGEISLAQVPGTLSSAPSGYEYFVKKVDNSGKAKSGGFLGTTASLYPKLSSELDDAIIAEVNMYVLFIESANAFKGNGANIKVQTNLRLSGPEAIEMTSDNKVKLKGQNEFFMASSGVNFYHGKMGMGATTSYAGTLSKSLEINDVIEDTKLQSFANRSYGSATQTVYGTFFSATNKSASAAKVVDVDPKKYYDGVYLGAKKFMDFHTQAFLNSF